MIAAIGASLLDVGYAGAALDGVARYRGGDT